MLARLFDDRCALGGVADVALDEQPVGPLAAEIAQHRSSFRLARMIMNRNPRALCAEAARHRRADARRGAGDEHDLAGKVRYDKPRVPQGGVSHFLEIRWRSGAECEGSAAIGQPRRGFVGTHKNPAKNSGARALVLGGASLARLRQKPPDGALRVGPSYGL